MPITETLADIREKATDAVVTVQSTIVEVNKQIADTLRDAVETLPEIPGREVVAAQLPFARELFDLNVKFATELADIWLPKAATTVSAVKPAAAPKTRTPKVAKAEAQAAQAHTTDAVAS